jgi:hypothetical protein
VREQLEVHEQINSIFLLLLLVVVLRFNIFFFHSDFNDAARFGWWKLDTRIFCRCFSIDDAKIELKFRGIFSLSEMLRG